MFKSLRISLFVLIVFSGSLLYGQLSMVQKGGDLEFRDGIELFQKEKFVLAQRTFNQVLKSDLGSQSEIRIDAEYYYALCAIELFHSNADALLRRFIENHPESAHQVEARFNLAKFQFRKKRYEDVLNILSQVDQLDLSHEEQAEFNFKAGYSHFQLDEFKEAAQYFYEIKDTDNPYVSAARYYYAHIAYQDKKYVTAATNFRKISKDKQFGPLVPYYLSQVYYLQKKYDTLLAYAPAVLDSAPPKREEEIRKMIGVAYYETERYKEAIPYLEKYLTKKTGVKEDYYQLGYAHYKVGQYDLAKKNLELSIGENDTLAQNAYYYIGESNIRLGSKRQAKEAFRSAYREGPDEEIKEDALFNYAMTAYELSFHPYDDAILAFEEYINSYPNSSKLANAYEYLVGVYYTTKNYKEALASIDRIKDQNIRLLEAKQRIAYYRGIELFRENKYREAIDLFTISRSNNYNQKLFAMAQFWKAEAFYSLKDYDNANDSYSTFLSSPGSLSLPEYTKGFYGLAYTNYESQKYKSAIFWFREYLDNSVPEHVGLINDAYLRIGDSYFIQKDYSNAIKYYDQAIKLNVNQQDYASLQSAISSGVLGNYKNKAERLKTLIQDYPKSVHHDDALFELGKTYLILNREQDAMAFYQQLINDYPSSNYLAEAYLKVGLIHFNLKQDDAAMASFDKVIKDFPSTGSAKEALEKVRKVFIEKADAEGFEAYINGVPFANISKAKLDSTSYVIAENNYLGGNCEKATRDFTNYLKRYPEGIFSLNAHFYRAECEAKANFDQEAILDYNEVLSRSPNKFLEKSLLQLAKLHLEMDQLKEAGEYFEQLKSTAERQQNREFAINSLMEIRFRQGKLRSSWGNGKIGFSKSN